MRKRGEDFWAEFEFYLSDLIVGCVLDMVLVTLMAPAAKLGPRSMRSSNGVSRFRARLLLPYPALTPNPTSMLHAGL